ncbi:MAG: coiled-coil protein [Thermoplasmatota archaeon]
MPDRAPQQERRTMTAAETASQPKTDTPAPAADEAAAPKAQVDVRNLQDKFNSLIEGRNQSNDLARAAAEERNLLNEQRRTKSQELEVHKAARDAANEVMRTHRAARDAYQDQAKALIAQKKGKAGALDRSLALQVRKLQNDIAAMVEQQQTAVLSPSKEKVLVEKIRDMFLELKSKEVELKAQKTVEIDLSDTDGSIDSFFAKADEEHAKVVAALKEAQGHHEKFIAGVKEVRVLVQEANKKHAEFVAHKQKADESHNKAMELREKVMAVRGERKAEYDAQRKEIQQVNQTARKNVADPRALDRIKDDALEQLKKGGKISLGF